MHSKIPVTVIVTTLNEAANLPRCLAALERFAEVVVVDSHSADGTTDIAKSLGARVEMFRWSGAYPKKRQWCLDHLALAHERVFFIDADEEVTPALCDEIAALDWRHAGYYVRGNFVVRGRELKFGLNNSKLCLFDRRLVAFPVIDDLAAPGMGEIEGHYQPVGKSRDATFGAIKAPLRHHAACDISRFRARHQAYAAWRAEVEEKLPADPRRGRRLLNAIYRRLPAKRMFFGIYYYFVKLGVLEYPHNVEIYREKCRYLGL